MYIDYTDICLQSVLQTYPVRAMYMYFKKNH